MTSGFSSRTSEWSTNGNHREKNDNGWKWYSTPFWVTIPLNWMLWKLNTVAVNDICSRMPVKWLILFSQSTGLSYSSIETYERLTIRIHENYKKSLTLQFYSGPACVFSKHARWPPAYTWMSATGNSYQPRLILIFHCIFKLVSKVILFNPRSARAKHRIPNSILQVAASIHGMFDYVLVDGNLETNPWLKIKRYLDTGEFGFFGSTVMPGPQLQEAIPITKKIKELYPGTITIWGGYFASNQYQPIENCRWWKYFTGCFKFPL